MEPRFVIGIAGPSCSGKSSLARHLSGVVATSGVAYISLDRYYRDLLEQSSPDPTKVNFDDPAALDLDRFCDDLAALVAGQGILAPRYSFRTHRRLPELTPIAPHRTVIVEGLYSLHLPRVRDLLTHSVYMELGRDACLARRLGRDSADRGRDLGDIQRQFDTQTWPMHLQYGCRQVGYAGLVLSGDLPPREAAAAVMRYVLGDRACCGCRRP